MCCIITILLVIGPRAAAIVWALIDSARWQVTFDNLLLPCIGIVILPWTTLAYVLVAPGGLGGLDWLWIAIAFLIDIGSTSGGAFGNRNRIREYRNR